MPSSVPASGGTSPDQLAADVAPALEAAPARATEAAPSPTEPLAPAAWGTSPPPKRRGAGRWIAITLVLVVVLAVAAGGGAYIASASLSQTYSPQRALTTYFDAQKRGDVNAMWANANYLRGDGSYEQFFNKDALAAMMSIDQNKAISDVKISGSRAVDSSTTVLTVSLQWGGSQHSDDYTLHKNLADTHYFFYNTWKLDIPYTSIGFSLPNQAGAISVDGMSLPSNTVTSIQTIAGYHSVTMQKTAFYDAATKLANGVDVSPNITFDGTISPTATAAIATVVKAGAVVCDAKQYTDCPGHTYHSGGAAYTIYFLDGLPGYPSGIEYNYYVFNYSGDLTNGMLITIGKDTDTAYAHGTCGVTMTVDGNRKYRFSGEWGADITVSNGAFKATVYPNSAKSKA